MCGHLHVQKVREFVNCCATLDFHMPELRTSCVARAAQRLWLDCDNTHTGRIETAYQAHAVGDSATCPPAIGSPLLASCSSSARELAVMRPCCDIFGLHRQRKGCFHPRQIAQTFPALRGHRGASTWLPLHTLAPREIVLGTPGQLGAPLPRSAGIDVALGGGRRRWESKRGLRR